MNTWPTKKSQWLKGEKKAEDLFSLSTTRDVL